MTTYTDDFTHALRAVLRTVAIHGLLPSERGEYVSPHASTCERMIVGVGYVERVGCGWKLTTQGNALAACLPKSG